jgi:hypothetical protein
MPNWCANYVTFSGAHVAKVDKLFEQLTDEQTNSGGGVRPTWRGLDKHDVRYMFDIEDYGDHSYRFNTKWAPSLALLMMIGRRFKVGFMTRWDECGNGVYGKAIYDPAMFDILMVADGSGVNFIYNHEKEVYVYEGEEYESEYDFIDDAIDKLVMMPISKDQVFRENS